MDLAGDSARRKAADLARLTDAEREALSLLAEGHTAKSIASVTGRTVASVNERLRQARLKTGAPSSRELARLLKAQENRDEEMGIAAGDPGVPERRPPGSIIRGALPMGILLFAVAMGGLWFSETPQPAAQPQDQKSTPTIILPKGLFPPSDQEPRRLAELVRTERRDDAWAPGAEDELKRHYAALASAGRISVQRITCSSSVCETIGTMPEKDTKRLNATMRELQNSKRNDLALSARVKLSSMAFGGGVFAAYWMRSS